MKYHGKGNTTILSQTINVTRPNAITATTCMLDKNCLQEPQGCLPHDPNCLFISLRQVSDSIIPFDCRLPLLRYTNSNCKYS